MNKHRNIFYKFLFIAMTMVAMSWVTPVQASHIIGAEIRYQCLGGNQYKIILDVYRDCYFALPGADFDEPAYVSAFDEDGNYLDQPNISFNPLFRDTLNNNISADPCLLPPSNVCVEHARYEGIYTINHPGGIYLVYQRCCRNETITNIMMPDTTGSTYFTYITPESRALCNSSPEFDFYPPIFVCVGKDIEHNHAAADTFNQENDSLVYRFYTPYVGGSIDLPNPTHKKVTSPPYDTVVWVDPPYNLDSILGPSTIAELNIDPHTGLITGHPQIQGQFVVGVLVEEYRNGVLLSVTRRDFQYNVGECVQVTASIEADSAQCDNLTVEFGNNTAGPDNFEWYYIQGPDTVFFSDEFEPTYTFPDTGKYQIMLVAEPGWDCVDTTYHPLLLQYNSLTTDFSWETYDCTEESVLVLEDLSVDFVSPPVDWLWEVVIENDTLTSNAQDTLFVIPHPSDGTISLTVRSKNGCVQTKTVDFETGGNNPSDHLPDLIEICIGESTELNPDGNLTNGFTYQWASPVPPAQQTLINPIVTPPQPATYGYIVTITGYDDLCFSDDTVTVKVHPDVILDFEPNTDCNARVVHFVNNSQNAPLGYVWEFGDPTTNSDVSSLPTPTYTYPEYGTYDVTLMTTSDAVCGDTITKPIFLEEKILEADFDFDFVECEDGEVAVSFFDVSINNQFNTDGWLWEFSGVYNGTSPLASPTITVSQEGTLTVQLTITTEEDCVDATIPTELEIDLTELPCLVDGFELGCLEQGTTLNPCGDPNYTYQWTPSTGLDCTDCPSPFANPTETTTYTVFVENYSADTCFITRHVTVVVPDDVGLVVSDDLQTCEPTATLEASTSLLPVEYDWFDENGMLLADGPSSLTVNVSGYDDYIIRATDQYGCHYFDTVHVVGGPVNIETSGDEIICSDDPLDVLATNLDANDTLVWQWAPASAFSGGTNTNDPDLILVAGNQTVTVSAINQFGCEETEAIELDILDINNNLDFDFEIECNGSQVTFNNLSTDAYNYVWDFGDPLVTNDTSYAENPIYSYPGEGTYIVVLGLDFDLDCFRPIEKEVVIASTQFAVDFGFEYVDCSEDDVVIQFFDETQFFASNITIDSFEWVLSNGETSNEENPIFTIETGDDLGVDFTIWTSNECMGMDNEFIKFEFPNIPLEENIVLCPGDSVPLNPTGDVSFTYNWSPNTSISDPTAVNPVVWPSQTTTYTVQVTSFVPDTCSIVKEVTVFVPSEINVEANGETLTCGDPVTLEATSPVSPIDYTWTATPGGVIGMDATLTNYPSQDTWYEVEAIDQYGCTDTASIFVANESIDADLSGGDDNICPESEIQLQVTNNISDHTVDYQWLATPPGEIVSGGMTTTPTVLTPTAGTSSTYSVIAENQFGCDDTLSLTLDGYVFVPTVEEDATICIGEPTPLNPGADPNLNYIWSPQVGLSCYDCPSPIATLSQSQDYSVIVSQGFGFDNCADTIDVEAFVPEAIEISGAVDTFTCGGQIDLNAVTNVLTEINWYDEQGMLLQTGNPFPVNPSTEITYIATATDTFNCTEADTFTVVNNELEIQLDGGGVIDTCPQLSYNLCVNNLDPNDVLTYDWSANTNGEIVSGGNLACAEVSTVEGETASFSVTVANQYGCTSDEMAEITTHAFDPEIRDFVSVCPNVPTEINPDAAGSNLIYSWTPQVGLSCYDCPNPVATLTQDQQYEVVILGINSLDTCSFSGSVNVLVNPMIGISTTPSPDTSLCEMTDVTLAASTVSGLVTEICWFENSLDIEIGCNDEITVTPNETVVYYAVANDTLGCKDTAAVTVNAFPINVSLDEEIIFCEENEELTIEVINNDPAQVLTFSNWQDEQYIIGTSPDGSSITVDNVPPITLFSVDIENQYGCTLTDSTTVLYFDIDPTVGGITSTIDTIYFNSGEFSQLDLTDFNPDYFYEWIPQDGLSDPFIHNPEAAPSETTTYTLIISNEEGCIAERMHTIEVLNPDCEEPNIFLPNAFTPNGDGSNDMLFVRSNIIDNMELSIYNRWGELVFRTNDQNVGWDGMYKSERLAPDVYGFYLRADCYNGMEFTKKGNVMILR